MLRRFILVSATLVNIVAQIRPQLNFHFTASNSGHTPQTQNVPISTQQTYLFYTLTCRSPGNEVTVRINPNDDTTVMIGDHAGITPDTAGARSCLPAMSPIKASCAFSSYCEPYNECIATLPLVCPHGNGSSHLKTTQYVDVTVSVIDGDLKVTRCFAMCQGESETRPSASADDNPMISGLAVGLLVAGVVVLACFIILIAVALRMKRSVHSNKPTPESGDCSNKEGIKPKIPTKENSHCNSPNKESSHSSIDNLGNIDICIVK